MSVPWWIRIAYRCACGLAPKRVRRIYGGEMWSTFRDLYAQAAPQGRLAVGRLLVREAAHMWQAGAQRPWSFVAYFPRDVETIVRDVRHGFRSLRRDAGLTAFAIVIVGLGIGASSTVFNVFNALLLRPLPFDRPEQLVWIANGESANLSAQTAQVINLAELETGSQSLAGVAGFSPFYGAGDTRLGAGGEPERITAVPVTEDFFPLLGIEPSLGRSFSPEECRQNGPKAVILGDALWRRRFMADRSAIGRVITLDGAPATIVGVLPPAFDFAGTFSPGGRADVFVPFPLSPETNRQGNTLALIGRLRPGADLPSAQAEATVIGERIKSGRVGNTSRNSFRPRLSPLKARVTGRFATPVVVLVVAVAFLMLVVCANLSNLLLARASARRRDIAVRAALGAERHQLVREMLVESVMLSAAGAALGMGLAVTGTRLIAQLSGAAIPMLYAVRVDGMALGFVILAALVTGIAFGLLPAFQASGWSPQIVLHSNGRGAVGGRSRTQRAIVVAEIALVTVLLTGAGLLTRSLVRLLDVDLGFDSSNVITVRVDPQRRGTTRATRNLYFDEVLRQVQSVSGIEALGLTDALPLGDNFGWRQWTAKRQGQPEGERHVPLVRMIDEGYLPAMRIPVLAGRGFTAADTDGSEPVVLVNEAFAREMWPGRDALGQTLEVNEGTHRVVGVIRGVRYFGFERDAGAEMYLPLRQIGDYQIVDLVVRASGSAGALTSRLRDALKRADPNMPVTEFRTMAQLIDRSVFARRAMLWLVAGFAFCGLVLASLGIYAVISYSVGHRRQEIGLRMALGASPAELRRAVLAQTIRLVVAGLLIGLPMSWMTAHAIRGLLFGVPFTDGPTFALVIALLTIVAAIAGYVPARRASRIDPAAALRA
jgi:predicted permease